LIILMGQFRPNLFFEEVTMILYYGDGEIDQTEEKIPESTKEILSYIIDDYAFSMCDSHPMLGSGLKTFTKMELTDDGFRIVSTEWPNLWFGMKESRKRKDWIVHEISSLTGVHRIGAWDQDKARAIYNRIVEKLRSS